MGRRCIWTGSPEPGTSWRFADGCTRGGFKAWLYIMKPEEKRQSRMKYRLNNSAPGSRFLMPRSQRLTTADVNLYARKERGVSIEVFSEASFVAKRRMYFDYAGKWSSGHVSSEIREPRNTWYFAEGGRR